MSCCCVRRKTISSASSMEVPEPQFTPITKQASLQERSPYGRPKSVEIPGMRIEVLESPKPKREKSQDTEREKSKESSVSDSPVQTTIRLLPEYNLTEHESEKRVSLARLLNRRSRGESNHSVVASTKA